MTQQRSSSATGELADKIGEANLPAIDIYKTAIRVDPGHYVLMPADLRDEVMKALRAPAQLMQWQPIETAPRDRTAVWLLLDGRPYIGYCEPANDIFNRAENWFVKVSFQRRDRATNLPDEIYGTYHYDAHPTHWMPLPEVPALPSTDGSPPPDWKQDQAETSCLPRKSTECGSGK